MTVKELLKELQKEKYDTKNTPVYLALKTDRFALESVNIYDGEVHLGISEKDVPPQPNGDDVQIREDEQFYSSADLTEDE